MAAPDNDGSKPVNDKEEKHQPKDSAWSWEWSFIRNTIMDEMDNQRHERLEQCRVLESILADCKAGKPNRTQLEDVPPGIRMVRYFDWRNSPDPHCQREAHSVWACRAVSLKCGADLVEVRNCFHNGLDSKQAILRHSDGAVYEPSMDTDVTKRPCGEVQRKLGECVATNANALLLRDMERKSR